MKKCFCLLMIITVFSGHSQENLEDLLAAGIEDAQRFATGYISPATEGMMYNLSNNWVQSAEVKKPLKFEISLMGNATFIKDEKKRFTLNTADYNNLQFRDGSLVKEVATAFGENDPEIVVFAEVQDFTGTMTEEVEFLLPQGLASVNVNILPTAFLQARIGVFKATELKLRYFPRIDRDDVRTGLIGAGIQHELSQWMAGEELLPLAISGFIGYTHLNANYDFTDDTVIEGDNQQFDLIQNNWLLQLQGSTKLPVFNVYGGIGYVTGNSNFKVLGTYRVRAGIPLLENTNEFTDPFTVKNKISGIRGTLGVKLTLGFFGLHADYNIAEYSSVTAGMHFGI